MNKDVLLKAFRSTNTIKAICAASTAFVLFKSADAGHAFMKAQQTAISYKMTEHPAIAQKSCSQTNHDAFKECHRSLLETAERKKIESAKKATTKSLQSLRAIGFSIGIYGAFFFEKSRRSKVKRPFDR